jgi:hypothetical protein
MQKFKMWEFENIPMEVLEENPRGFNEKFTSELRCVFKDNQILSVSKKTFNKFNKMPAVQIYLVAVAANPKHDSDLSNDEKLSLKDLLNNPPAYFIALHRMPSFRSFDAITFAMFDCCDFRYLYLSLTSSFEVYKHRQEIISQCSDKMVMDVFHNKIRIVENAIHTVQIMTQDSNADIIQLAHRLVAQLVVMLADQLDVQIAIYLANHFESQIANHL